MINSVPDPLPHRLAKKRLLSALWELSRVFKFDGKKAHFSGNVGRLLVGSHSHSPSNLNEQRHQSGPSAGIQYREQMLPTNAAVSSPDAPASRRRLLTTLLARGIEIALAGVAGGLAALYVGRRQRDAEFISKLKVHKERFREGLDSRPKLDALRELLVENEDLMEGHPQVRAFYVRWFKDGESPGGRTGTTWTAEESTARYRAFLDDLQALPI